MVTQDTLTIFHDSNILPLPSVIRPSDNPCKTSVIKVKPNEHHQLHPELPPTEIWGYNGTFPGPIIEIEIGEKFHIKWKNGLKKCVPELLNTLPRICNDIPASMPLKAVKTTSDNQHLASSENNAEENLMDIVPNIVTHLHGGDTHPDSDGWTENTIQINESAFYTYERFKRISMLWYHDHAMGITRYNVFSGLAGLVFVRHIGLENQLFGINNNYSLTKRYNNFEYPLVFQDRNLETINNQPSGALTGKLLHKITVDTMEFFGPFNLVNGVINPWLPVKRANYRFRMVNGSNSRTYKFELRYDSDNTVVADQVFYQIGSDGGMLQKPLSLTNNQIILAPGERVDIIADFRFLNLSTHGNYVNLVNIAKAPYSGEDVTFINPKNLDNHQNLWQSLRQKNACVMQFRINNTTSQIHNFPFFLKHNLQIDTNKIIPHGAVPFPNHDAFPHQHHRIIALVEQTIPALNKKMLMLKELKVIESTDTTSTAFLTLESGTPNEKKYKEVASMFYDMQSIFVENGTSEVWKIINLTGDTHPFHIHLVQFQALEVHNYININDTRIEADQPSYDIKINDSIEPPRTLDIDQKAFKDTIRINPSEFMLLGLTFNSFNGKYMYHCHLLEHEDEEMMRPFSVLPKSTMTRMNMPM